MKMIRILFMFALVFAMGNAYGQVKVVSSGNAVFGTGTGDPEISNLESQGTNELELSLDAQSGNSDFSFQITNQTKGQFLYNNTLSGGGIEIRADQANTGNGGVGVAGRRVFISGTNGNVGIGTITPGAALHVNGSINYNGSLTNVSDRRLKSNVSDFNLGLNEVLALKAISFQYNGKAGITNPGTHVGLFAQDLQKVAPSLVSTWTYVKHAEQSAEDMLAEKSEVVESTEEFLQINESAIKYMLLNAVKEQHEIIKSLEARIAKLEGKK